MLENRQLLSPYTVTSTLDDGSAGTLRAAINAVNAGTNTEIDFQIAGTGVQTINLTSALPNITTNGVYVNGLSQGGPTNTVPLIELNGTSAGSNSNGLVLAGSGCIVSGLIVESFGQSGIEVTGTHNTIGGTTAGVGNIISGNAGDGVQITSSATGTAVEGNYIGTNVSGTSALGNSVGVAISGSDNTIGGTLAGARNIISGNSGTGVIFSGIGVTGVVVEGNYIGTNAKGNSIVANGLNGVQAQDSQCTIGGTVSGARNVISGNNNNGISLFASGVTVQGNYIGTNAAGSGALSNGFIGIEVFHPGNTIGGTVPGARNVISGNTGTKNNSSLAGGGIVLSASGCAVQGNYIGLTASGTMALKNNGGVIVVAPNNTIGGTSAAARNVISGNGGGVSIFHQNGTVSGVLVSGNFIGTNAAGSGAVPNGLGIAVADTQNTIGGTTSAARNIISANTNGGVILDTGSSANLLQGNYIGLTSTGTGLGNGGDGVLDNGSGNTIGGTVGGARNLISANKADGILYGSIASQGVVEGNNIGVDGSGGIALPNSVGIEILGNNNLVGGTVLAAHNIISGNTSAGVLIDGGSGNQVQGNFIGTNHAASSSIPNGDGVVITTAGNTVGGSVAGARNIISGNTSDGVRLSASGIAVQGNYIGTDGTGKIQLGNSGNGIDLLTGKNTIGGTVAAARNLISGNSKDGVLITGMFSSGVVVQGNYIGTNVSGTSALGNSIGVEIASGQSNTIGGSVNAARNIISGNSADGIRLDSSASKEVVEKNYIGTDPQGNPTVPNSGYGINIAGSNNSIGSGAASGSNLIGDNSLGGINLSSGSGDYFRDNSIFSNGGSQTGPGIVEASTANNGLGAPTLTSASYVGTTLTVNGTFTPPTANVSYILDFYANPTGDAEGKIYLGSLTVTPTSTQTQSFKFTKSTTVITTDPVITATLTDSTNDTSIFSNGVTA